MTRTAAMEMAQEAVNEAIGDLGCPTPVRCAERRRPNAAYPTRIAHYEDEEGIALLDAIAKRRGGLPVTALLRQLVREEAARVGLTAGSG